MVRVQREKIQSGWKKNERFEGEDGGASAALAQGAKWARFEAVEVYQLEESEDGVTVTVDVGSPKKERDAAGREAPGVRAAKSSESKKVE